MKVSIDSTLLRSALSAVLAVAAFGVLTARVQAAELDPITLSAPTSTIEQRCDIEPKTPPSASPRDRPKAIGP